MSNRARPILPSKVFVDLTTNCPRDCKGCVFGRNGVFPNARGLNKSLPVSMVLSILEDMKTLKITNVHFTGGGEPLLHPDITQILAKTNELGFRYGVTTCLDFTLSDELAKLLSKGRMRVSIWASKDAPFQYWHGEVASLPRVKGNIQRLKALGADIQFAFVLWKDNVEEIRPTMKLASELGCKFWIIKAYSPKTESILSKAELAIAKDKITMAGADFSVPCIDELHLVYDNERVRNCSYPYLRVHVDASGLVYPCWIHKYTPELAYGNLSDRSFKEIMEDPDRLAYLESFVCSTAFCKFQTTRKGEIL